MSELIVGIDLGTTNSEIAILEGGRPRVLLVDGDPILPSVVGLTEDGRLLVGKTARNQWALAPERTVKSVKRKMGRDETIELGDQKYKPQEISAMILRKLKDAAEQELRMPVRKAVITVPAYFNDSQRQATREAGELAGLEVVRIINEPTAAALTYDPKQEGTERFLVYDLGGGTFDVSIVHAEAGIFEVLASHGDTELGGDDFDERLADHIAQEFQDSFGVNLHDDRTAKARLLRAAEAAKRQLSDHPFAQIEEEFIAEKDGVPLHLSTEITREDYENLIRPLIDRTMTCLQQTLDDARLTAGQIQQVVLVGGSTRTPLIGTLLEERLGQPAHREVHPDLCVAMGAAVQAAIIAGEAVGSVLVDITPHSLGIKCLEYPENFSFNFNEFKFVPIIKRNTPLPANRSEVFCTVTDNQPAVDVEIFQGENDDVRRNHRVGKFLIEGLGRVPAGNQLVVQLDLTLDGTLKVSAREKSTGLSKQITVENAIAQFAMEERTAAQARLNRMWGESPEFENADSWSEPTETPTLADGPAEGQRESVQAEALLEKAGRLRDKASGEDQAELDQLTARVRNALTDRSWGDLRESCNELSDMLFYMEDA